MGVFKINKHYPKLFEPLQIGRVTVKNRVYLPSMCLNFAGPNGETTDQDVGYYRSMAMGGAGLITADYACISPEGRGMPGQRGIWKNDFIPGLSRLADVIKSRGAAATIQIHHAGVNSQTDDIVGPSAVSNKYFFQTKPRELKTEEVEELIEKYAQACLRAKTAGFDLVTLHGTHGYLICQFLSPIYNRRSDRFGRDRALFAIEIVKRVKELCGEDFPVIFRLDGDEMDVEGINIDRALETAVRLEEAGVDMFNITGATYDTIDYVIPNYFIEGEEPKEYYRFFDIAAEIKRELNVPVSSGGLVSDPNIAEKVLEEGLVDMVFIGRQLIADPFWPQKAKEGNSEDIRPCLACNEGCIRKIFTHTKTWCAVNPLNGYEYQWVTEEYLPTCSSEKKVLVIGAGPAGLEAARIAAIRGCNVTLVEKEDSIGGAVNIAGVPDFKYRFKRLINWYERQLEKLNIDLRLNTEAGPELVKELSPEVVIVATGSEPIIGSIEGIEKALLADDILKGQEVSGEDVIIVGGGQVGIETALYLAKNGKTVAIVEALSDIWRDTEPSAVLTLARTIEPKGLLQKYGITTKTGKPVIAIRDNGVVLIDKMGKEEFIKAQTVVSAIGRKPVKNQKLLECCEEAGAKTFIIGDARKPRKVIDAVHEGFTIALDI